MSLFLASCASFEETYYVGVFDKSNPQESAQFYRFKCRGSANLSNIKFETGLFDANAVDTLFGEVVDSSGSPVFNPQRMTAEKIAVVPYLAASADLNKLGVVGGGQAAEITDAKVDLTIIGQAPAITSADEVAADAVYIYDDDPADQAPKKISRIEVSGKLILRNSKGQIQLPPCQLLRAETQTGSIQIPWLDNLEIVGGNTTILANDAKFVRGEWRGKAHSANSQSEFHECSWLGDKYTITPGNVRVTTGRIKVSEGGIRCDQIKQFRATRGISLLATASSPAQPITAVAAPVPMDLDSAPHNPPQNLSSIAFESPHRIVVFWDKQQEKDWTNLDILDSHGAKPNPNDWKSIKDDKADGHGAARVLVFHNVILHDPNSFKLRELKTPNHLSPVVFPESFDTDKLKVSSGLVHLSSHQARHNATQNRKNVVAYSGSEEYLIRLGPEGHETVEPLNGRRFVIFMHSDPSAITRKIHAITNTELTKNFVAQALTAPRQIEQMTATQAIADDIAHDKQLASTLKENINGKSADQLKDRLMQFATSLEGK